MMVAKLYTTRAHVVTNGNEEIALKGITKVLNPDFSLLLNQPNAKDLFLSQKIRGLAGWTEIFFSKSSCRMEIIVEMKRLQWKTL